MVYIMLNVDSYIYYKHLLVVAYYLCMNAIFVVFKILKINMLYV